MKHKKNLKPFQKKVRRKWSQQDDIITIIDDDSSEELDFNAKKSKEEEKKEEQQKDEIIFIKIKQTEKSSMKQKMRTINQTLKIQEVSTIQFQVYSKDNIYLLF